MSVVPTENTPGSSVNGVTTTDLELSDATGMVQLTTVVLTPGSIISTSMSMEQFRNVGGSSSVEKLKQSEVSISKEVFMALLGPFLSHAFLFSLA